MKTKISITATSLLLRMRSYFQGESILKKTYKEEQPLRSELFSTWQMERHGTKVAGSHSVMSGKNSDKLLKRLDKNEDVLLQVRDLLVEAMRDKLPLTPASEWLLDNFYLIEEQISIGRRHLPKGYSQNLPHLTSGASAGFPRVYDIALEIIAHSDGRVDLINLSSFINAYQKENNLTLGELWAIPIMLRLALIENLRRVAISIALDRIDQNIAGYWAGRLLDDAENQPKNIILTVADMARTGPVLSSCFVAEFTRRLQGRGAGLTLPLTWVDQQLVETGYTSAELIHKENQSQAADQVSMRNSIESLRLLRTTEWRDFVESISAVDQVLRQDPVYGHMDFATRDTYRHVIESIGQKSPLSETEIASIAIRLTAADKEHEKEHEENRRNHHVGYYLIDKGIAETQKEARMVCSFSDKVKAFFMAHKLLYYSGGIVITTLVLCLAVCLFAYHQSVHYTLIIFVFILSFIGASQLAIALANWIVTRIVQPRLLPKMDYSGGIPAEDATMIAVPCMLTSLSNIEELVEALEVRYLANPHPHLFYSLVADYKDASQAVLPEDHPLLQHAVRNIEALNKKYKSSEHTANTADIFYLFQRDRTWSDREKVWMGRERKRGKLGDLNQFLLHRTHNAATDREAKSKTGAFSTITGDIQRLPVIKYIITLDADTKLPRASASRMIATMAHPLNHPVYAPGSGRVVAGHGILQPRVEVTLPKSSSSLFVRMHSMDSGLDPYTKVSSDLYQDLYGEGSFIGKGIYQVEVFEKVLAGRFPPNRILSHDLLEGCYLRSGLISDVTLLEDYPDNYLLDSRRQHRWVRGDWQIAAWALPWAPGADGHLHKNPLSLLSKWKIADNIRRALVPPSLVILLCMGWLSLPYPWLWTTCVIAVFVVPILLNSVWHLLHKPKDVDLKPHLREFAWKTWEHFLLELFYIACLPYQAWQHLDAAGRTLWRMYCTHTHLLQWTASAMLAGKKKPSLTGTYVSMWTAPATTLIIAFFLYHLSLNAFLVAMPILLLWLLAPALVWRTNQPKKPKVDKLSEDDLAFLHHISRKTWSFFESFVTGQENFLPPDNYQEEPRAVIAHRTSPTNIGLSLLAGLSAYDFGYICQSELLDRTAATLGTMGRLEKYRGHFYNWYDTLTLDPLPPKYISTVDSGNLAGHLIILRQGLLQIGFDPLIPINTFEGLRDTLLLDRQRYETDKDFFAAQNRLEACQADVHAHQNDLLYHYRNFMELAGLAETLIHTHSPSQNEKLQAISQSKTAPAVQPQAPQAAAILQETGSEANTSPMQVIAASGIVSLHRQLMALIQMIRSAAPWIPVLDNTSQNEQEQLLQEFPWLLDNAHLYKIKGYPQKMAATAVPAEIKTQYRQGGPPYTQIHGLKAELLLDLIQQGAAAATGYIEHAVALAETCERYADMDYSFLYDPSKHLLRIGYNVQERQADKSYYDLLASEARLGIYVAITQGKIPQESWFALGRLLTGIGKTPVLLSWSGSMFEYLMPQLVMPTYENTLLEQTSKGLIKRQISFAASRNVPWGISESGYNAVDASLNYQYRAFGVPGLGLKRGLGEDLVVAPYATMLALMIRPALATANLKRMAEKGYTGQFGFYEAIDFTKNRLPREGEEALIRSFMVHHQGMGFLAIAYLLKQAKMQARFEADPGLQSSLLLLQEKIPKATIFYAHTPDNAQAGHETDPSKIDIIRTPFTRHPEIKLLSNGHYHVMISNAGGGYSRWDDLAVSRWRQDGTLDNWGIFCYIKNLAEGNYWSNTYQPVLGTTDIYEAVFSQGHAAFKRRDDSIETRTEIVVSPEDNVEVRRIRITNKGFGTKRLEVTSYAEVVLAAQSADEAHPAFSNLFVETSILKDQQAILCTRRPRSAGEVPPWMFHLMSVYGVNSSGISYETDRAKFIGRGRSTRYPVAMDKSGPLSGSEGSVLDPIVSIRHALELKAGATAVIDLIIGVAATQDICLALLDKYQDRHLKNRAFELSWTHSQVLLRQINASEAEAKLYSKMAGYILYPSEDVRAAPAVIASNHKNQSGLWAYSISGDLPIVLLRVQSAENITLIRQLINAHTYWRLKGIKADLVIWNENFGSYRQDLQEQIQSLIALAGSVSVNAQYGGIFLRAADQIPMEDRVLMQTVARIIIDDQLGSLEEQLLSSQKTRLLPPELNKTAAMRTDKATNNINKSQPEGLVFNNGMGGFTRDGKEYIIRSTGNSRTPMPWSNVIANASFGTVISESGGSYTWAGNAHEYRLSPWPNDPIQDSCGESIYIRDEENGIYWSPMPLPVTSNGTYITRHGFGYTVFEHTANGITSELWVYVDRDLPVRYQWLKLHNISGRERKLSVTGYIQWVLGDESGKTAPYIVTEKVPDQPAILAINRYSASYPETVCFYAASGKDYSLTADRAAFIGRSGTPAAPAGLKRSRLSGRAGAALDPCACIQLQVQMYADQQTEISFRLGAGDNKAHALELLAQTGPQGTGEEHPSVQALARVHEQWNQILGQTKITTPDPALNFLAGGWLTYQTLSCRIWGRSGYYQSGGAFGFRDQLQDTLALLNTRPDITRAQILLSASRQFRQGDVQHWWHPPTGRGVRTRCSDDYLWLPFVLAEYVFTTGDEAILEEQISYLEGRPLNAHEDSYYDLPIVTEDKEPLYQHALKAIQHGLRMGVHGLPLMGTGDWNDGMDKVGEEGKGESIWLGFFLYRVLMQFKEISLRMMDQSSVDMFMHQAEQLKTNLNQQGWDGNWFRRAYFDDGTPLGSEQNQECQIDSIAQSWSVLSGAGAADKKQTALTSLENRLVRPKEGVILLLDPAFDKSDLNPGYIKGYAPGVRENGGQYTHAAIWAMMAFAETGDREKVWELFKMVHPIAHTMTGQALDIYKVEPYVMAADVYNSPQHRGRGGWTWYTGSAGWMQQFMIRYLLGLRRSGNQLSFKPCLPKEWKQYSMEYRYGTAVYHIEIQVSNDSPATYYLDGHPQGDAYITLTDDGQQHLVNVQ